VGPGDPGQRRSHLGRRLLKVAVEGGGLANRWRVPRLVLGGPGRSLPLSDQPVEAVEEIPGDRAGLAGADGPAVALDHGDHLGGGPGQEALVGGVDVVAVHGPLDDGDSGLPGKLDHGVAGDPFQDPGVDRGRDQFATFDDEDVVTSAFGDLALVVEHQSFEAAGVGPLDLGEDRVEVVQRLGHARKVREGKG